MRFRRDFYWERPLRVPENKSSDNPSFANPNDSVRQWIFFLFDPISFYLFSFGSLPKVPPGKSIQLTKIMSIYALASSHVPLSVVNKRWRTMEKCKVILVQLGSPESPKVSDVRVFLKEFLGDPRVVDLPRLFWNFILYLFVLPFRPAKSARAYSRIWDGDGFPLVKITNNFAKKIAEKMPPHIEVHSCFLLGKGRLNEILDAWEKEPNDDRAQKVYVIPQFPQYSESTTASGLDAVGKELSTRSVIPRFEFITNWQRLKPFIDGSCRQIRETFDKNPFDTLVLSFHGLPKRRILFKDDPYYLHCYETFELIKRQLVEGDSKFKDMKIQIAFQSRFGSEEWLTPDTVDVAIDEVKDGRKKVGVYCPSFVVDCLETIDEIGFELGEDLKEEGGEVILIPCLNDDDRWADDYRKHLLNLTDPTKDANEDSYPDPKIQNQIPEVKMKSEPLGTEAKQSIKIVFFTLFLDLVGFSIIFPLFPALAQYYLENDGQNFFLQAIFSLVQQFTMFGGAQTSFTPIVLFGGILGALYSLLQFIAAPFWGNLSDKIGRRPVLIVSMVGLALSYLLWIFAGNFTILILARFIGGVMAGNISTATAVVADVTTEKNRSKGMAFIGIAFALGFIIGPALGGILSQWDMSGGVINGESLALNPFSAPALLAFVLTCWNIFFLTFKFKETLKEKSQNKSFRSANPLRLFKKRDFPGVDLINWGHFLFLAAFSGMEFTLTFLAVERLGYSSMDNAYMFIFIGFILAMVQGGYVRRKANIVGEKKMVMRGMALVSVGLVAIGFAKNSFLIYFGLFFLAVGSSMVIPCLTALISLYSPADRQGEMIGIFRSLGALARVLGPLMACLIYWQWGTASPYFLGAVFMILPILILKKVPDQKAA